VIVTGGGGGIGSAACRAIAGEGGKVLVADLEPARAAAVAEDIVRNGESPSPSASTSPTAHRCGA